MRMKFFEGREDEWMKKKNGKSNLRESSCFSITPSFRTTINPPHSFAIILSDLKGFRK